MRPDEIGDDIDLVADTIIAADGDFGKAMSEPGVEEALGHINDFEAANCGIDSSGGGPDEAPVTEPTPGAEVVDIKAVNFGFEGVPQNLSAGPVSLGFTNTTTDTAHEMVLIKLGEGADLDELLARDQQPSEDEAKDIGFTQAGPGEGPHYINADLEPGRYALICFLPGPGGKAHYDLGMKTTFTVS